MEFLCAKCGKKHPEQMVALDLGDGERNKKLLEQIREALGQAANSGVSFTQSFGQTNLVTLFNWLEREQIVRFVFTRQELSQYVSQSLEDISSLDYGKDYEFRIDAAQFYELLISCLSRYKTSGRGNIVFSEDPLRLRAADIAGSETDFIEELRKIQRIASDTPGLLLFEESINIRTVQDKKGKEFLKECRSVANHKRIAVQKYCGVCHEPISEFAGYNEEYVIAFLASQRVGKTACAAAMIASLEEFPGKISISTPKCDKVWEEFDKNCLVPYKRGRPPKKTATEQEFALNFSVQLKINSEIRKSQITLTFVDIPGEYMSTEGVSETWYQQYEDLYRCVDSFWLCVDVYLLKEQIPSDVSAEDSGHVNSTSLVSTTRIIQNLQRINDLCLRGQRRPTAIILTKSDEFEKGMCAMQGTVNLSPAERNDLFPQNAFHPHAGEKKVLNMDHVLLYEREFFDISKRVRNILHRENKRLIDSVESIFPLRAFFSLSAYGHGGISEQSENPPMSFQVLLPLLWFLALRSRIGVICEYLTEHKSFLGKPIMETKTVYTSFKQKSERVRQNLLEPMRSAKGELVFNKDHKNLQDMPVLSDAKGSRR
jgi:hypothetical protein